MAREIVDIHIKLPRDLYEKVKELADEEDRSLSGEIRRALKAWVDVAGK